MGKGQLPASVLIQTFQIFVYTVTLIEENSCCSISQIKVLLQQAGYLL
jgi:hypothetical protein